MNIVGILLAAGQGLRYDAGGQHCKLLARRSSGPAAGQVIAVAAAHALRAVVAPVIAVVQQPTPGPSESSKDASSDEAQSTLRQLLAQAGCQVLPWSADDGSVPGSGASIACAVRSSRAAAGWLIALADMPDIRATTIAAVRDALAGGADCVAPYYRGQRGHPVGFGAACGAQLAALRGDRGARAVLEGRALLRIDVDDPGIVFDVDTPAER